MNDEQNAPITRSTLAVSLMFALTFAYAAAFSALSLLKYRNFDWSTIDIANNFRWYDWMLTAWWQKGLTGWNAYHLSGLIIQPVGVAFGVLHALVRSPNLWLVMPACAMALGIPALFFFARHHLRHDWLALAAAAAYAFNPYINLETFFGFRYDALVLPLVVGLWYARDRDRPRLFWILLLLTNMTRINLVIVNGLFALLSFRTTKQAYLKKAAIVCGAWLLAAIFAQLLLQQSSSPQMAEKISLGFVARDVLKPIWENPAQIGSIISHHVGIDKLRWVYQYLIPVLGLPLIAPLVLLPVIAEAGNVFLSSLILDSFVPGLYGLYSKYGFEYLHMAVILVIYLHLASIFGAKKLLARRDRPSSRRVAVFGVGWIAVMLVYHFFFTPPYFGPVPLTRSFNLKYYAQTEHVRNMRAAYDSLPTNITILMNGVFCERVEERGRSRRYMSGWTPADTYFFDAMIVDLYSFEMGMTRAEFLSRTVAVLSQPNFGVTYFKDGIIVAEKNVAADLNSAVINFIRAREDLLLRNLPNPYADGAKITAASPAQPRFYSPTQLLPEDR